MPHFVVFIPGAVGYSAEQQLRSVGLDSLVDTALGPDTGNATLDGNDGRLIRWIDPERLVSNASADIDGKTWWHNFDGRFSIGFDGEVMPADVLRVRRYSDLPQLESFPVILGGNRWLVPIARRVPKRWGQNEDGRPCLLPKQDFAWYWDEVLAVWHRIANGEFPPDEPPADVFELAVKALAMNYRLTPEVVIATGLLDASDAVKVIAAAVEQSLEFTARVHYEARADNPVLTQKKTA